MKKLTLMFMCLLMSAWSAFAQTNITGTVISAEDGEPVIGASVAVKGTTTGTVTDFDGKFTLSVPSSAKTLVISYVGMETKEEAIKSVMQIKLSSTSQQLDEVMVVAYGTAKKSSFTGSADLVKNEKITARTVSNVSKALEGTIAGVQTTSGGGQPGKDAKLIIRGLGSINANNDPLYVLDGIPYDGDISAINPSDIENISVLKDASASALYGARGANGVVIITTKKGGKGRTNIDLKATWGVTSRAFPVYDRLDPSQFMEKTFEGVKNQYQYADKNPASEAEARQLALDRYMGVLGGEMYNPYNIPSAQLIDKNTGKINSSAKLKYQDDWFKEAENTAPLRQEYLLSVSGGMEKLNYMFSLGYLDEQGLAKNTGFDRYSGRLNVDSQIRDWLKGGLSSTFSTTRQQYIMETGGASYYNIWYSSMQIAPIYPVYQRDGNGDFVYGENGKRLFDYGENRPQFNNMNWIAAMEDDRRERKSDNLSARTYFELGDKKNESLGFFRDLKLTVNLGVDYRNRGTLVYQNPYNGNSSTVGGSSNRSNTRMLSYTFNQLLNYTKEFGKNSLDVLLGHEYYSYSNQYLEAGRQGFPYGGIYELANAATITEGTSYNQLYLIESVFSRVNYSFDNKYYLSASFRTDGSSRFEKGNRWGQFWSVGAAWRMSDELFMENTKSWLDNLTIKASYGSQGNDNILRDVDGVLESDYYAWQGLYDMTFPNFNYAGGMLMSMENKNLKWEKNNNMNFGLEAKLFDSRLGVSFEYYIKQTTDLLLFRPKAQSTGFGGYYDNVGDMKNQGFDLSLNGSIIRNKDFTWDMGLLVSAFKNKVTRLNEESNGQIVLGRTILKEGETLNSFYLPITAGVNPDNGNMRFYQFDKDGNVLMKDGGQTPDLTENYSAANANHRKICGSRIPDFYGSWSNNFTYKGFDLSILTTYSVGGKVNDGVYATLMDRREPGKAIHADLLNSWQKPGDTGNVPIYKYGVNTQIADNFLLDASYFSIKNITLGYSLPQSWMKKAGMRNVRVFATGDNLFLLSSKKGMDPQYNFTGTQDYMYTPVRNISFGIDIKF